LDVEFHETPVSVIKTASGSGLTKRRSRSSARGIRNMSGMWTNLGAKTSPSGNRCKKGESVKRGRAHERRGIGFDLWATQSTPTEHATRVMLAKRPGRVASS
jgi:hypothetical protein